MQRTLENESHTYGGGRSVGRGTVPKVPPLRIPQIEFLPNLWDLCSTPLRGPWSAGGDIPPGGGGGSRSLTSLFAGGGGGRREINVSISRIYLIIRHGSRRRRSQRGKRRRLRLFATLLGREEKG